MVGCSNVEFYVATIAIFMNILSFIEKNDVCKTKRGNFAKI